MYSREERFFSLGEVTTLGKGKTQLAVLRLNTAIMSHLDHAVVVGLMYSFVLGGWVGIFL